MSLIRPDWFDVMSFFDDDFPFRTSRLSTKLNSVATWKPSCDISEKKDSFVVYAELPGMKKENVKINYDSDSKLLSISGELKDEKKETNDKLHRVERRYGSFERKFMLPDGVDTNQITASMNNGVLEVTLPKLQLEQKTKLRDIQIS